MTFVAPARPRVGDQIRSARHRKKWTQRQLADAVGVDRKTIDNYENDRTYPRNPTVIEDVLGITLDGDGVTRDGTGHRIADREELLEALRLIEEDIRRRRDEANGRAG